MKFCFTNSYIYKTEYKITIKWLETPYSLQLFVNFVKQFRKYEFIQILQIMKIQYTKLNFSKLLTLFVLNAVLISCGTYQNAIIEDGIYSNETNTEGKKKVILLNERAYADYNSDYFAEELDLVDEINREDIFLEENEYNSTDSIKASAKVEEALDYTPTQSWGNEEKNDVVININFRQDPFWMGDVWAFAPFRFNYWSFNRTRFNYWGWRNNYFYGNWWNNYYGWNNRRWSSQWGNHYGWNNFYNRYRGTNVAYHTGGRNGRVDTYINYRRGRYGSSRRGSYNTSGRRQLNNSNSVAYNNFTKTKKRKPRSTGNNNLIRNTRNNTTNINPKSTIKTKNTRTVRTKRTVRTRTKNTREPNRNNRTTRNTRSTFPSSNTRSTRSSSRSFGSSSSRGSSSRGSSSRSSSRRKN